VIGADGTNHDEVLAAGKEARARLETLFDDLLRSTALYD
jgi:hypothetical protein